MIFDPKLFTLFTFIIINLLILFLVKTRTTAITSLIISHLIAVLFFSLSISNYNSFKEIVLALIVYSMVILFLVSNYNPTENAGVKAAKIRNPLTSSFFALIILITVMAIFSAIFLITKNVTQIAVLIHDKKFNKQTEIMQNPMILPSHPVHIAVKKLYLGKKFEEEWSDKTYAELEMNNKKRARLKDKLSDNFLLKRSSDVILIIVAVSTSLLLLTNKKTEAHS